MVLLLSTGFFCVMTTNDILASSVVFCAAIVLRTRWGIDRMVVKRMAILFGRWQLCWGAGE